MRRRDRNACHCPDRSRSGRGAFIGTALYGDTIGYYPVARTKEGKRRAASQALRIPLFHAVVLAVVLKLSGGGAPKAARPAADLLSTSVLVLGMAVIGFNLATVRSDDPDMLLIARILAVRQVGAVVLVAVALGVEAALVGVLGTREQEAATLAALSP
ncbi:hypothetical protein [Sphingomonas sp. Leaf62]|uniref:hypothetical protein n=1 Tax=Sphingomonas sp. Leaf62 TaxID=1736228 RepID=UPI0006FC1934|nr:hypothetical protein [Sphingomonas sp. Leaf62]KQN69188.1 hypothetical protein ASE91_09270 [Sphingomonas sp. Leaf62]